MTRERYSYLGQHGTPDWHTVKVLDHHDFEEVETWIVRCLKGRWTVDWMYGDERSIPAEDRGCMLYIFEDVEDATLAITFWG